MKICVELLNGPKQYVTVEADDTVGRKELTTTMLLSGLTIRACARSSEDGTYEEAEGSDGEQMLTWAMELPVGYSWIFEVNITKAAITMMAVSPIFS